MLGLAFRFIRRKKETALASLSVVYLLGYLVWSINAYRNNLGLLSAFETQYFISGIVPFCVFISTLIIFRGSQKSAANLLRYIDAKNFHLSALVTTLIIYLAIIALIIYAVIRFGKGWLDIPLKAMGIQELIEVFATLFGFTFASKIGISVALQVLAKSDLAFKGAIARAYKKIMVAFAKITISNVNWTYAMLLILVAIIVSAYYSIRIYPFLPQELGGIRPKSVCLKFKKEIFKDSVFTQIENQCNDVDSSREFEYMAYYKNEDRLILKKGVSRSSIEIKLDAIEYINWK